MDFSHVHKSLDRYTYVEHQHKTRTALAQRDTRRTGKKTNDTISTSNATFKVKIYSKHHSIDKYSTAASGLVNKNILV